MRYREVFAGPHTLQSFTLSRCIPKHLRARVYSVPEHICADQEWTLPKHQRILMSSANTDCIYRMSDGEGKERTGLLTIPSAKSGAPSDSL